MDSVNGLLQMREKYRAEHGGESRYVRDNSAQETTPESEESELIEVKIKNIQLEDEKDSKERPSSNKLIVEEIDSDEKSNDYVIVDKEDIIVQGRENNEERQSIFSNKIETDQDRLPASLIIDTESKGICFFRKSFFKYFTNFSTKQNRPRNLLPKRYSSKNCPIWRTT